MPVYNSRAYLKDSISSILGQSFTDFELIAIDEGSTDDSVDIMESYGDSRIVLLKNDHDFICSLNRGIAAARGKYIVRMDADDIMLPHRLETQLQYMEDNPGIDICGSWMESFGVGVDTRVSKALQRHEDIIAGMLEYCCLFHPTIIMRRDSVSKLPLFPNLYRQEFIYAEDYKLWTDLAMSGLRFANIPEVLVKYRQSESQNMNKYSARMRDNSLRIRSEYLEFVSEKLIEGDESLFNVIDSAIELTNRDILSFDTLTKMICELYTHGLEELRHAGKIKVLFCIQTLGGGGAEKVLIDILKRFDFAKYCVDLLLFDRSGIHLSAIPSAVRSFTLEEMENLALTEYNVEVAFLEGMAVKYIANRDSNARKVAWVHIDLFDNHWTETLYMNYAEEAFDFSRMDNIVFVSNDAKTQFNRLFPLMDVHQTVIHNLIDVGNIQGRSNAFPVEKNKLTLCSVGRLIEQKGYRRLISVVSRLKHTDGLDFELWILGEGEQKSVLKESIHRYSLEDVVYLKGFEKNPYPFMQASDLFVSSSYYEGYPLVVCEALCLGKAIVATRVSGTKEALGYGEFGLLVDDDEEALYCGLKEMITNKSMRIEYSYKALARSELFDANITMQAIYDILS